MNAKPADASRGRLQFLLVAVVFAGPLILAAWMYYSGSAFAPKSGTNSGVLLQPIVSLTEILPESPIHAEAGDLWILLYSNDEACGDPCLETLYRLRQSRLMLGNDMIRVVRVFLHGDSAPDTVRLEEQHAGLITTTDKDLGELLERKRPPEMPAGGVYLIDPLGNLVMYFSPDLDPKDMVSDIEHLLRLSHIG